MSANRSKKNVTAGNDIHDLRDVERAAKCAQDALEAILRWALAPETRARDLHEVERELLGKVLELGRSVLVAHLAERGTGRAHAVEVGSGANVVTLPYHCEKLVTYCSIFGELTFPRAYFWSWRRAAEGVAPLDEDLNLPQRRYSYVIQELATLFAAQGPFDRVSETFRKVFGLDLWKQGVELMVRDAGADVERYYREHAPPDPATEGEILVIALDGKGVPMVKAAQPKRPRRYVGEKANKKRMAVVSAVYTVHPHMRTAEEIVTSLFGEAPPDARVDRVEPCNKHVRATLFNLDEAVAKVMRIARERDPEDEKTRVVLIDGERRLVNREEFKGWIQILDIFHVMEKLWEAGIALYGQRSSVAENWVRSGLLDLLSGRLERVIDRLRKAASSAPGLSSHRRNKLRTTAAYYEKNRQRMRYDEFLGMGLPIGTGVVEGACGSLVNDRADRSGMRWTRIGAKNVLELRAVDQNGDWEDFWRWRVREEGARLYPERLRLVA